MNRKSDVLSKVCELVSGGDLESAAAIVRRDYPFEPRAAVERKYGEAAALRVFIRDGFIDRYSGDRLVFPGALRILSLTLPVEFPYHPNWKMSESHYAFWELSPTIDHVVPVTRGGSDSDENWVTTSMLRNSAKSNWTLEELGWALKPPGAPEDWDGLLSWFRSYVVQHPDVLKTANVRCWHRAALAVTSEAEI